MVRPQERLESSRRKLLYCISTIAGSGLSSLNTELQMSYTVLHTGALRFGYRVSGISDPSRVYVSYKCVTGAYESVRFRCLETPAVGVLSATPGGTMRALIRLLISV